MTNFKKIVLLLSLIIIFVMLSGCNTNIITDPTNSSSAPIKTENIPSKTTETFPTATDNIFIEEPDMERIEFGSCNTDKLNFGIKYYFDEKKLEWSNDFESEEIIIEQIDDETANKFESAIKKANLISWKDTYFIEVEDLMYDGQWIISVYYKDGSTKRIAGVGIKPKKGYLFEEAVSILDWPWEWY